MKAKESKRDPFDFGQTGGIKINNEKTHLVCLEFTSYHQSISEALDQLNAFEVFSKQKRIIIKPNLVQSSPFPITTSAECVEAIIQYCKRHSSAELIIAEGSGGDNTHKVYKELGYRELERKYGVLLVDLDEVETINLKDARCKLLKEFYIAPVLLDSFVISVPVLKAHSMAGVTLTLKNMMGIAPMKWYQASAFRKSKLHGRSNEELHQYIVDLNCYRKPDLTILDARVGMAKAHLWGPKCNPPVNRIVAGFDPVAVDAIGTKLLNMDWREIGHIRWADGVLGKVPEFSDGWFRHTTVSKERSSS